MSAYNATQFISHLLQAIEDVLEDKLGTEGLVTIAVEVAKHIKKLSEDVFSGMSHMEISDFGAFVTNTSKALAEKLGLHMDITVTQEGDHYKVVTKLQEKHGTPAVLIPITIVALALEEARQRADKKFVISDAKVSGDVFEFLLVPL